MTPTPIMTAPLLAPEFYPTVCEPLEEVGAAEPRDAAAALAFALGRLADPKDPRPWVMATTPTWLRERGRPFARGLAGQASGNRGAERLIWIRAEKEAAALWALEEALKSGAVAAGIVTAEQPSFVITRRLDFAARAGGARGVVLRCGPALDLSAARMRWRIAAMPSAASRFDPLAPGATRLMAELARRRGGPPGRWELEQDDETGGFRVVPGLAGDGLDASGPDRDGRRRAGLAA